MNNITKVNLTLHEQLRSGRRILDDGESEGSLGCALKKCRPALLGQLREKNVLINVREIRAGTETLIYVECAPFDYSRGFCLSDGQKKQKK